jgi:hypothetical protein
MSCGGAFDRVDGYEVRTVPWTLACWMAFFFAAATSLLLKVFHVSDGVLRAISRHVVLISTCKT